MFKFADHPFSVSVVGWRAGPAHAGQEVMPDKFIDDRITAVLTALVGVPDNAFEERCHLFWNTAQRCYDEIRFHPPIDDQTQYLSCGFPPGKGYVHLAAVSQSALQDIRTDYLRYLFGNGMQGDFVLGHSSGEIGKRFGCLARIAVFGFLWSGGYFLGSHDPGYAFVVDGHTGFSAHLLGQLLGAQRVVVIFVDTTYVLSKVGILGRQLWFVVVTVA